MAWGKKKSKGDSSERNLTDLYATAQSKYSTRNSQFQTLRKYFSNDDTTWWANEYFKVDRVNSTFNYARPIVEKAASFLMGDAPNFASIPGSGKRTDQIGSSKAEKILTEALRVNRFKRIGLTAAKESALLGISWLKVFIEQEEGKPAIPRVVLCKPEYVYPEVYQSVYSEKLFYVIYAYQLPLEVARREYGEDVKPDSELEFEDPTKSEQASDKTTYLEFWSDDQYILQVGGLEIENGENPYGFIPFIPLPWLTDPGRLQGLGIVDPMVDANMLLNILVSRKADSVFMHCNPPMKYTKAKLTSRDEFEKDVEGGVYFLPGDSDLKYMEWEGEPPDITEMQNFLMRHIYDASYMPESAFTGGNSGMTGVAMKLGFDPLVKMIHQVRSNWEPGLEKMCEYLLRLIEKYMANDAITELTTTAKTKSRTINLLGKDVAGFYNVEVVWKDMLPKDDINAANFEIQKFKEEVQSLWTTQEHLGMSSPDEEQERMAEEFDKPWLRTKQTAVQQGGDAKALMALNKAAETTNQIQTQQQLPLENQANVEMNPNQIGGITPGAPGFPAAPTTPEESEAAWSQTEGAGTPEAMF